MTHSCVGGSQKLFIPVNKSHTHSKNVDNSYTEG